jgi:hypothetical protein
MRYLVTKKGNTSTPQTCSIDKTYRDVWLRSFLDEPIRSLDPRGIQRGFRRKAGFSSVGRGHEVPPVVRLVVAIGVGVPSEDIL